MSPIFFVKHRVPTLFLLTVVLPTAIATAYYGFIASDIYVSESQFVVRSPERQTTSPLGLMLRSAGFSRAQDDAYTVQEFMLSRDVLRHLNEQMNLGKAFASLSVDRLNRFGGIDPDDSFEALHRYYREKVSVRTDSTSSVTTLAVRAFTPEDAYVLNRTLLEQSEGLVNQLNERGRQDMVRYAQAEAHAAEKQARSAALALSAFRDAQGVVDPERQANVQMQQLAKLQDDLIATTTQIAQLHRFAPESSQITSMEIRARSLREEIDRETRRMTGGQRSLVNKAAQYQRLQLDAEFANKQLASAMASLEASRSEAQRKQVYIEHIAQPSRPDRAQEPKRVRGVLTTVVLGLAAWGILSLFISGVREHQS